jgi:UDP-N-acetylglucosamine--N-acetylmuramyl-(pentapeptide) pyrophosphoryl-undecaprenol N-acetylglucosamine transferase
MAHTLRVVIAGGGTGGHLYPGIAVARELLARHEGADVSFAGTQKGIEARVVPREGFALDVIRSGGLKGKSIADRARGAALLPLGFIDAWRIVSARRPDLVIGVGGYSSGPVVLVAAMRGVATLLEQNAVPGLTNRMLAPFIGAAAVTFDSTSVFFGSKAFVSGNPVRPEFLRGGQRAELRGGRRSMRRRPSAGSGLWRFSGRARDQRGHGGGSGGLAAASHLRLTHQTVNEMWRWCAPPIEKRALQADVEPFL